LKLAGIDLAWHGESNPSAIATGVLNGNQLILDGIETDTIGLNSIINYLIELDSLKGIAIDAPLIIRNQKGQRVCEKELGKMYGAKGASCHTSNLKLYPNALSVRLSKMLLDRGYQHLGLNKWQVECYPHPSIIEFFDLPERLKYKKGTVAQKKEGQGKLASKLLDLTESQTLKLVIPDHFQHFFRAEYINTLRGRTLKSNEDTLDSVVCLCVAASYALKFAHTRFGDIPNGYIWVPKGNLI